MARLKDQLIDERNEALLTVEETAAALALGKFDTHEASSRFRDIIKLYSRASFMGFSEWRRYQTWKQLHPELVRDTDETLDPPYGKNRKASNAIDNASLATLIEYAKDITQLAAIDNGVAEMLDAYANGVPVDDILA